MNSMHQFAANVAGEISTVKFICGQQLYCHNCPFYNKETDVCIFRSLNLAFPLEWDIECLEG